MSGAWVWRGERLKLAEAQRLLGGKAAGLVRLKGESFSVPPFYVVTAEAFRRTLQRQPWASSLVERLGEAVREDEDSLFLAGDELRAGIEQLALPPELVDAVQAAHAGFCPSEALVAVRSSAVGEDGRRHSFAGMHATVLGVQGANVVLEAVKEVWSSAYSRAALAYRKSQALPLDDVAMAVIIQQMIPADVSGVIFTCHPVSGDPHRLCLSLVQGSGQALVWGAVSGETCYIDKQTMETTSPPSLLDERQVNHIAQAALAIERVFHRPQDIEFCFDADGALHILQSRAVTRVQALGPAAGNHRIWDNSNIVESYSGVTTPMTFSFIRRAYAIVYLCFAEVMGIPSHAIEANRATFEKMLGLFHGRVYYNLKNWHRLVRLFPGYRYNARFMDTMMGVRESFALEDEDPRPGLLCRWLVEFPGLLRLIARSTWSFLRIRRLVGRFERDFDTHYRRLCKTDFEALAPHELLALYFEMEDALLRNWKAPIINDFFVMVFFGVLKRLCVSWGLDETGALANALISGEGNIESTEPLRMLQQLARMAKEDDELTRLILYEPAETLPQRIGSDPRFGRFQELMDKYLELYGFRCVDELKLEVESYRDRPDLVYSLLRTYLVRIDGSPLDPADMEASNRRIRREAEEQALTALSKTRSWLPRKMIFSRVLANARLGVRNRENLRFARTRIYGVLREILRALGRRFAEVDLLEDPGDIFYLTFDEVSDFVGGTAVTSDLKNLVKTRRAEYDRYRSEMNPPDSRFETYGMAYQNSFRRPGAAAKAKESENGVLRGVGCCPGVASGPVQVRRHPFEGDELAGAILVAERTDPGWTPIFPAFAGLIIERGSPLSHSAIVARELGIPAIVGVTGAAGRLRTGQHVTMDGGQATIHVHNGDPDSTTSATQKAE